MKNLIITLGLIILFSMLLSFQTEFNTLLIQNLKNTY